MYEFATGPLVWIAFIIFIGGSIYKLMSMLILAQKEKSVLPTWNAKFGLRSVMHWVVPFASRNQRMHPVMTVVSFVFHLCLLITPLFVMGHAVLWKQSWGIRWFNLPAWAADIMTLVVISGFFFFFVRRLVAPEVRNVNTWKDYVLLVIVVAPFITGFVAHQQWLPYSTIIIAHIVTGVLWLIAIPFTWLSHMLWFFFSRSYMGSEFGSVRNARDW